MRKQSNQNVLRWIIFTLIAVQSEAWHVERSSILRRWSTRSYNFNKSSSFLMMFVSQAPSSSSSFSFLLIPTRANKKSKTINKTPISYSKTLLFLTTSASDLSMDRINGSSSKFSTSDGAAVSPNDNHLFQHPFELLDQIAAVDAGAEHRLPEAPPLSYQKFLTMQEKRTVVTIRYSDDAGLKPYFLTVAKKLKASHPDLIIERQILPRTEKGDSGEKEPTFEIVIDNKVAVGIGKGRPHKAKISRMQKERSVFVSMSELDIAISRARRRVRPTTTVYGDNEETSLTQDKTTTTSN